jgi:hypothetical protein
MPVASPVLERIPGTPEPTEGDITHPQQYDLWDQHVSSETGTESECGIPDQPADQMNPAVSKAQAHMWGVVEAYDLTGTVMFDPAYFPAGALFECVLAQRALRDQASAAGRVIVNMVRYQTLADHDTWSRQLRRLR